MRPTAIGLFLLTLASWGQANPTPHPLLTRSEAWLRQEAWEQAAQGFERFLQSEPFSPDRARAHLGAGQARLKMEQPALARDHFDRGLEAAADQVVRRNLLQWRAFLREREGDWAAALADWEAALGLASTDEEARTLRLRIVYNLARQGEWRAVLDRARLESLAPQDPSGPLTLSLALRAAAALENWDLAADLIERVRDSGDEALQRDLEWYRAEVAFRRGPTPDPQTLWNLLESSDRGTVQTAAARLLGLFQNDRLSLLRLAEWAKARTDLDPRLALYLWIRLAQLSESLPGPTARDYWQRAWDLRDRTEVPAQVALRLALAAAALSPEDGLRSLALLPTDELNARLVRWDILGRAHQDAAAFELGAEILRATPNHPDRPVWLLRQGILAARLGRWDDLDRWAAEAGSAALRSESWLRLSIHAALRRNRATEAHALRERLASLAPGNPAYQMDLLMSALALGRTDQARQLIQNLGNLSAFRRPPYSNELVFAEGLLALRQGKLSDADRLWSRLAEDAPVRDGFKPQVAYFRSWADLNLDPPRIDRARSRLEALLREAPDNSLANPARLLLGRALALTGRTAAAIEVYQSAAHGDERPQALLALSDLYLGLGQTERAREQLVALQTEFPSLRPLAERRLIDVTAAPADRPAALEQLHRRWPNDPTGQLALFEAAVSWSDQENWERAAALFGQFTRQYPRQERLEAAAVLGAAAYLKIDQPLEALLLLGLAENQNRILQQRDQIQILKARALRALGRYSEALMALQALPAAARTAPVARLIQELRFLDEGRAPREAELLVALQDVESDAATKDAARLELLALWLDRNTWREAELQQTLGQALNATQPALRARAELFHGRVLQHRGQPNPAVEAYLRAVRTPGVDAETAAEALYRAWLLLRNLSPAQAPTVLQTLQTRFADSVWARRAREETP